MLQVKARGCNHTTLHTDEAFDSLLVHLGTLEKKKLARITLGALPKILLCRQEARV
jgi:hypothetical protein